MAIPTLAMIPSGYKANKIYSVLPTDGAGDLATTRASSATRINKDGLIETVLTGIPRLDYSDGSCPSLLLEPESTNLITYSESFDNSYWTKENSSILLNNIISPDGTQNATKLLANSTNARHSLRSQSIFLANGGSFSIFAKAGEYSNFAFQNISDLSYLKFNLSNGTIISVDSGWSNEKIESFGNGWYRLSGSVSVNKIVVFGLLDNSGDVDFVGDGVDGAYVWGAQVEELPYTTSYIPTQGSTVTRLADSCSQTITDTLVSPTEGTLFIDMNSWQSGSYGSSSVSFGLYLDGSQTNAVGFTSNQAANSLRAQMRDSSGNNYIGDNFTPSSRDKLAIKWDGTNVSFFKNGSLFSSVPNTGGKSYNTISLPLAVRTGLFPINDFRLYNTALTDAELQALTTL